jgi:hypothetical protein
LLFASVSQAIPNNAVPFVTVISPVSINPGSMGVTLTVRGVGFVAASKVVWNGTPLATTFVSAVRLTAVVPDTFDAAQGLGSVVVSSPAPGGGKSNLTLIPVAAVQASTTFLTVPTSSITVGMNPRGLVAADLNGDGIIDLTGDEHYAFILHRSPRGSGKGDAGRPDPRTGCFESRVQDSGLAVEPQCAPPDTPRGRTLGALCRAARLEIAEVGRDEGRA